MTGISRPIDHNTIEIEHVGKSKAKIESKMTLSYLAELREGKVAASSN